MSHDPSATEPEYLGDAPADRGRQPRARRRVGVLAVTAVGAAGAIAAGGWAAATLLSGGSQPAEAVPADALAYAAVDLDPSATQKLEAMRIIGKFPALDEELGLDAQDDIRRAIFEDSELAACAGVDYDDDVAPWIGERMAFALLPAEEDGGTPQPVAALQVTDEDAAADKLAELLACGGSDTDDDAPGGFAVADGYAILAETEAVAKAAVASAAEGSLADDTTYQRWTDEAGEPGIVSLYAAPQAVDAALAAQDQLTEESWFGEGQGEADVELPPMPSGQLDAETVEKLFGDFEGGAGVIRFEDGAVEAEFAAGGLPKQYVALGGEPTAIGDLPASTGLAYSFSLAEGWLDTSLDMMGSMAGMPLEEMWAEGEAATGLELPEDIETLLGDGVSLALDSGLDASVFESQDPSEIPAGILISGDEGRIMAVVDKIKAAIGPDAEMLVAEAGDGRVALGLSAEYVGRLLEKGALGDDPTFRSAVPDADRAEGVFYLSFDAGDGWVEELVDGFAEMFAPFTDEPDPAEDAEVRENLEPLEAVGVSSWLDGDVARGRFRLTTD